MAEKEKKPKPKRILSSPESDKFVDDNVEVHDVADEEALYRNPDVWVCIDGRRIKVEELIKLGIPGGTRGAFWSFLATLTKIEKNTGKNAFLGYTEMRRAAETILGGLSWHTDTHHPEHPADCRGCGHCWAMLDPNKKDIYELGDYRNAAREDAHAYSPRKEKDKTFSVDKYEGEHKEGAIFIIDDDLKKGRGKVITLPGTDKRNQDIQGFVYNRTMAEGLYEYLGKRMYLQFKDRFDAAGITEEEVMKTFKEVAQEHLGITSKSIAEGLPVKYVYWDEAGRLTKSDKDPQEAKKSRKEKKAEKAKEKAQRGKEKDEQKKEDEETGAMIERKGQSILGRMYKAMETSAKVGAIASVILGAASEVKAFLPSFMIAKLAIFNAPLAVLGVTVAAGVVTGKLLRKAWDAYRKKK